MGKTDQETIEQIVCQDIPDTRKLQQLRLESIRKSNSYEEFMKQHYPKDYETPRIVRIPNGDQAMTYSLAIPLSFPSCDFTGHKLGTKIETDFVRWTSWDCQKGAMHLTTEKGLNKLIKIFVKNNLPISLETSFGSIFGTRFQGERQEAGLSVPHSWYVNGNDPYQCLFRHQFVVCEQDVMAVPYWFLVEETTFVKTKEEKEHQSASHTKSFSETKINKYNCWAIFYSSIHDISIKPEHTLPKTLEKHIKKDLGEDTYQGKIIASSVKLLKIGEPVEIYNPSWIKA